MMATFSFEVDKSEAPRLRAVLKALGVTKLKIKEDETKMTKEEFFDKLESARKQIKNGQSTTINSKEELETFFDSLWILR